MGFVVTLFALILAVILIAVVVAFLNRFYRKSSRDVSLIRSGYGGQSIVLTGGCLALPFLHKIDEINMRTIRVDVVRTGKQSSITEDRMRVDIEMEFYVRVEPSMEGVATAAQSLGSKTLTSDGITNLLEGRFVAAIQSVTAKQTMDTLHENRAEFVEQLTALLSDNLNANGLILDSVSLTRMDQTPFGSMDENNAFNAVGMRRLAEVIATNKKKRAEIEADAEVSVRNTELDAIKKKLHLSLEQEDAQISQLLEVEKIKASSDAASAQAREQALVASESARIEREQATQASELKKQRELQQLEIETQLNKEIHKADSAIALALKQAEEAQALAKAEHSRTHVVLAKESVQTERDNAIANRSRELAMKRVEEAGQVAEANTATEVNVLLQKSKAEAEAVRIAAAATRERMLAESEGDRALIDARNAQSNELMAHKLEQYRLDRLPEIVSQLVKPAEKIDSIRINHVSGFGNANAGPSNHGGGNDSGGAAASPGGGDRPPVNQVMDGILGMALQLPAMKNIGDSIGQDFGTVFDSLQSTGNKAKNPQDNSVARPSDRRFEEPDNNIDSGH
ncbi:MAG: flotillin family protein [Granulosicoccus sp.]